MSDAAQETATQRSLRDVFKPREMALVAILCAGASVLINGGVSPLIVFYAILGNIGYLAVDRGLAKHHTGSWYGQPEDIPEAN